MRLLTYYTTCYVTENALVEGVHVAVANTQNLCERQIVPVYCTSAIVPALLL